MTMNLSFESKVALVTGAAGASATVAMTHIASHDVQLARVILFSGATLRALGRYERSARIEGDLCP